MPTIPSPCLALLTDRTRVSPNWTLAQAVAPAITGGVNLVVFREDDLPRTPRRTVARFLKEGIKGRVPWVVMGGVELAADAGADGAHLELSAQTAVGARQALEPDRLLGVTVQDVDSARAAREARADYLLVYLDWSAPETAFATLATFVNAVDTPILAAADPPLDLVPALLRIGAAGVGIIEPGMAAYNRTEACRAYWTALNEA
jgi:thiamine-phosphate pyrophosphorylase